MTIHVLARFRVRPQTLPQAGEAIREFIARIGWEEPGTLHHASLQELPCRKQRRRRPSCT
jgi:hypothetical protein